MNYDNSRADHQRYERGEHPNYQIPPGRHIPVDPGFAQAEAYNNMQGFGADVGSNTAEATGAFPYGFTSRKMIPPYNYENFNNDNPQHMSQPFPYGDVFTNPIALRYGSQLMDTGKQVVNKELNRYISYFRLKYYFAVDAAYTFNKLKLLLFPFNHKIWVPKIVNDEMPIPKDDVNAPDLYIPLMAAITYLLIVGFVMGTQKMFSPEFLGTMASRALATIFIELIVNLVTIYITNLKTRLTAWDLLAFSGYKFVGMVVAVLLNRSFGRLGYSIGITYCSVALSFFLVRTLRWHLMNESLSQYNTDNNTFSGSNVYQGKRRLYFLIWIAFMQPFLMWWLSSGLPSN